MESEEDIEQIKHLFSNRGSETNRPGNKWEKKERMIIRRRRLADDLHIYLEVDKYKFKRVHEFIYLGLHRRKKFILKWEHRYKQEIDAIMH